MSLNLNITFLPQYLYPNMMYFLTISLVIGANVLLFDTSLPTLLRIF